MFEQHREPMLVLDPLADRIVDANPAAARLLGYDRAVLRAMAASALHPGQRPALIVFTQGAMARDTGGPRRSFPGTRTAGACASNTPRARSGTTGSS